MMVAGWCSSALAGLSAVGYVDLDRRLGAAAGLAQAARPRRASRGLRRRRHAASASSSPTTCASRSRATRSRSTLKDATVAIEDAALLQAQGRRLRGRRPRRGQEPRVRQDRPGRLDDHDAAGPQPLHLARSGPTSARSARPSWPRSSRTSTRRTGSSTSTSTPCPTAPRRPDRDRRPGGRARRTSTSRPSKLDARAGRAARRPAAGAVARTRPCARPRRPKARRNEVLGEMAKQQHDHAAQTAQATMATRRSACTCRRYFTEPPRGLLLRLRQGRADQGATARKTVRQGGLRVYTTIDLEKQEAARKAIAGRLAGIGPSSAIVTIDPHERLHPGDGVLGGLRQVEVQPRRPGPPPARLDVQGDGADDRAAQAAWTRDSTTYVSQAAELQRPDRAGPIDVQTYAARLPRLDQPRQGDADVRQHRLRAARARPRPAGDQADRLRHGHHDPPRRLPGRGARRPDARRLPARDGRRLRDDRLRRLPQPADRDHQDHASPTAQSGRAAAALPRQARRGASQDGVTSEATQILEQNVQARHRHARARSAARRPARPAPPTSFTDAWFVGFTPRLATAVWVGYPNAQVQMYTEYHGGPVAGGTFPAEIWRDYMKQAKGSFCGDFPPPKEPFDVHAVLRQVRAQRRQGHRRVDDQQTAAASTRRRRRPRPTPTPGTTPTTATATATGTAQGQVQPGPLRVAAAGRPPRSPRQQGGNGQDGGTAAPTG